MMAFAKRYHRWIFTRIADSIRPRTLEVGAGIGTFSELLLDCEHLTLLDKSSLCCDCLRSRFQKYNHVEVRHRDICNVSPNRLLGSDFDSIVCLDVIEHIEEDELALCRMNALLSSTGTLILKVPALPMLYGTIDQMLGHHRRYQQHELNTKLNKAGFFPIQQCYTNPVGIIGWYLNGHILRRKQQSRHQIVCFDRYVVPMLRRLESWFRMPIGQSLLVVCRKKKEHSS